MANYTIEQCLNVAAIPEDKKEWLRQLQASRLPAVNGKTFNAANQTALVTVVNAEFEKSATAKAKRAEKNEQRSQCYKLLKEMIGAKGVPQLISPSKLLPKLQELKSTIEAESRFEKINTALQASGLTREQLLEYLQRQ